MSDTRTLVTQLLQRLGEADAEGIASLFADSIDWFVPDSTGLPWAGVRSRREEIAPYFRLMWSHFVPGRSQARVDKILVDGDDAVILGHFSHVLASNGRTMETAIAMHLTVQDGAIVRLHLYEDTLAVARAFAPTA